MQPAAFIEDIDGEFPAIHHVTGGSDPLEHPYTGSVAFKDPVQCRRKGGGQKLRAAYFIQEDKRFFCRKSFFQKAGAHVLEHFRMKFRMMRPPQGEYTGILRIVRDFQSWTLSVAYGETHDVSVLIQKPPRGEAAGDYVIFRQSGTYETGFSRF